MDGDAAEYNAAVDRFFKIYRPLQKQYDLCMHSEFSIFSDGYIEVWEYGGAAKKHCIFHIKDEDEASCYRRAAEALESYRNIKGEGAADEKKAG